MSYPKYKVSVWYINDEGTGSTPTTKYFSERMKAEAQYHSYCTGCASSDYPVHTCVLETVEGVQIKKECYQHTTEDTVETTEATE